MRFAFYFFGVSMRLAVNVLVNGTYGSAELSLRDSFGEFLPGGLHEGL